MRLGFTGTREGMTEKQMHLVNFFVCNWNVSIFHHGDCIGADKEAHDIVKSMDKRPRIFIHPPKHEALRAFCAGDFSYEPEHYNKRNRAIVNRTNRLIATPKHSLVTNIAALKGGTWNTVRYAIEREKYVRIIYPNGRMKVYNDNDT